MTDLIPIVVSVTLCVTFGVLVCALLWGNHLVKRAQREEERRIDNSCPICGRFLGEYVPFQPGTKMTWVPVNTYKVYKRVCLDCWHPNLEKELHDFYQAKEQ